MSVSPEEVLRFKEPTKGFMCPLSANVYGIEFLSFKVKDYETKKTIFDVSRENSVTIGALSNNDSFGEDSYRKIRYNFSEDVLRTPTISTTLIFSVGDNEVEDFRMIERHYFRDQLVKSYDFSFGFCIPCSTNTWEAVYAVPLLDDALIEQMIAHPFETRSDSFYFVNGELIMHNKAEYNYYSESADAKPAGEGGAGSKGGSKSRPGAKSSKSTPSAPGKNGGDEPSAQAKSGAKSSF